MDDGFKITAPGWLSAISAKFQPPDVTGMLLPEIGKAVVEAVAAHLETSPLVRDYLTGLPKGPGTCCPNDPVDELVSHVARMVGVKGIDKSDPFINHGWMNQLIRPVFKFERQKLIEAIDSEVRAGRLKLDAREQALLRFSPQLADAVDQLFLGVFRRVVAPYQLLSEDERRQFNADATRQLPEYDYTVYDIEKKDDGHYELTNRRPWAVAFPDEIGEIYRAVSSIMNNLPGSERGLLYYFNRLIAAYDCREVDQLEERWMEVDRAWIDFGSDLLVLPVHGIETYGAPQAVQPEFRLEFRTREDLGTLHSVKLCTVEVGHDLGLSTQMVERIKQRLSHTDMGVFVTAIKAGFDLNFRLAGQSAPNRQAVQDTGARIFVGATGERESLRVLHELLGKFCDPETATAAQKLLTTRELRLHVYSHECAHPLGRTTKIDASLKEMSTELEEAKASLVGYLCLDRMDSSVRSRQARIAATVARCIRFFQKHKMSDLTAGPYIRENKVAAVTLIDAGILSLGEDGIHINWDAATARAWKEELSLFCTTVTEAYACLDPKAVNQVACEYYGYEPRLRQLQPLIDWCQREATKTAPA
ncbi:hypothetical protein A2994_00610 [candidate division Kazan bacterium RIFCSPLOWO2_01_FULL_48_13]|uniref:DUF7897 domain-containing protein n=1 Tax=candidate division Kazan bacterium RIFCSPLOWO2_01_FULL_48_13 TaxID=1798539 RepID=A0A1F4PR52_UNCK3|nr:MAG: hypothetical protein A2994_00610 [candidate division Kazan bacterium RIFCSPLOWO2_01_FULL_48_13]